VKVLGETLTIHTDQVQQFVDITKQVRETVGRLAIQDGILVINTLHTTVALFVNEFQSALIEDVGTVLQSLVPRRAGYRHDDPAHSDCDRGNGHAHLRSMLLGRSVAVPVAEGDMVLGQYQSIILAELDGPRDRKVTIQAVGV
jgi:secondary thiamine-phosphate synthase enzyme